jgi:hypothetical protein
MPTNEKPASEKFNQVAARRLLVRAGLSAVALTSAVLMRSCDDDKPATTNQEVVTRPTSTTSAPRTTVYRPKGYPATTVPPDTTIPRMPTTLHPSSPSEHTPTTRYHMPPSTLRPGYERPPEHPAPTPEPQQPEFDPSKEL